MRPITLMSTAAVLSLAAAAPSQAQNGLLTPAATITWPQWQGRLALSLSPQNLNAAARLSGSSLLGDYYFYRHPMTSVTSPLGGFRATSGLMFGNTAPRLPTGLGAAFNSSRGLMLSRTSLGLQPEARTDGNDGNAASYLGLGYTLVSLRGGWGLSADIGLATTRANNVIGRGSSLGKNNFEDNLRDWRLTPLMQLGLSYSF